MVNVERPLLLRYGLALAAVAVALLLRWPLWPARVTRATPGLDTHVSSY